MKTFKQFAVLALAVGGATAGGLAQARDHGVQWSVTLASPFNLPLPPVPVITISRPAVVVHAPHRGPVYAPVYEPAPVYYRQTERRHHGWRGRGDADGDGIPNRHDRVYNPRGDRDGDGVPNRHDRVYNPYGDRDRDGVPNRDDRVYNPYGDRDRDGVPNRDDRNDRNPRRH